MVLDNSELKQKSEVILIFHHINICNRLVRQYGYIFISNVHKAGKYAINL